MIENSKDVTILTFVSLSSVTANTYYYQANNNYDG